MGKKEDIMKLVIGLQTCNRIKFTKEVISSILKHNPNSVKYPWVVYDDNSTDNTIDYLKGLPYIDELVTSKNRRGITNGIKQLVLEAANYGQIILYIQNDWRQVRYIDLKAIENFFESYPNAGHLQTTQYKGKDNARPSSTAERINLYTKEKITPGNTITIGAEKFIPGNWHYCDLPGFSRISIAKDMFNGPLNESVRIKHFSTCGCDNYLLENQPYRNIDVNSRTQTPNRKL